MKNLALGFCSLRPVQLPEQINDAREVQYLTAINQLKRVLPKSFDLVICENTIDDPEQIVNDDLRDLLSETEMCALGSEANIGVNNKGAGEIFMLQAALNEIDLSSYENVAYVTARHIYTCPYVFERTESLEKSALISNPDFSFLNGKFIESHKEGLYNDMFFSMKTSIMVDYARYGMSYIEDPTTPNIGSEHILYNYINENNVEYEWLNWLGLIRNDWERNKNILDLNNFHIC